MLERYDFEENVVADAIVVQCGDPRLQKIFNQFLSKELNIQHPAQISLAGSVSPIGIQHIAKNHYRALKNQLHFFLKHFPNAKVVIINHEECRMYESIRKFFRQEILEQEKGDILRTASLVEILSPAARNIEGYIARLENGNTGKKVYFEKII